MKKGLLFGIMVIMYSFILVGCSKKDGIIGTWSYGSSSSFQYVFNDDKTCSYAGRNCTYSVDGDKLSILYDGDTAPFETTFRIEDDKLIIKDSFNNDVTYTRK